MLKELRILKDKQLEFGVITEENTKSGKYSILIKPESLRPRDSMKNLASISTDHSISDQDFQ
jgi:hypothetical protein